MIGRIQEKNISFPSAATVSTKADGSIQDPDYKTANSSFGVAGVKDSFEKARDVDWLGNLGINGGFLVDPTGYPGEEWLWENSEVQ